MCSALEGYWIANMLTRFKSRPCQRMLNTVGQKKSVQPRKRSTLHLGQ